MVKKKSHTKSKGGSTNRPKPLTPKISVTREGKRRYGEGGKAAK